MKNLRALFFIGLLFLSACSSLSSSFNGSDQVTGLSAWQLFTTGEKAMVAGNFDDAVKYFESLDSQYPFSPYSEQMLLNLIYAYHRAGDNGAASATAKRFIHLYPRARHVDYAYYMKGVANFEQDHGYFTRFLPMDGALRDVTISREAYNDFATFLKRFPRSQYTPDARQRMLYLRNMFARKEIYAARSFFKRKAYVAAANRASNVVTMYSQSPSTPEALAMMVRANRALGLTRQADESLLVLRKNYPDNGYTKKFA